MTTALTGWYVFFLGLATGIVCLDLTVYRKVSPPWLRWTLIGLAFCVASRYLTMALFALSPDPRRWSWLSRCWFATSMGLTMPSVLVLDQLLRHPSWSATKVLRYFAPFLAAYSLMIVCGRFEFVRDAFIGWRPALTSGWRIFLSIVQTCFVLGFCALCVLILRQVRSRRVRIAVSGLLLAHLYLGLDGLLLATGHVYFRPFLYSEIIALAAIGHAFDVALQKIV